MSAFSPGMYAPPNFGADYSAKFNAIYPELAKKHGVPLYEFFLDGVAGRFEYNQYDGIHPNEIGTNMVMETVWKYLEPLLEPAA